MRNQVALCVFQLFPKLLFPLLLNLLFWDPDDTTPENDASLEKAIDFVINPAIGVPRLYMISGLVRWDQLLPSFVGMLQLGTES